MTKRRRKVQETQKNFIVNVFSWRKTKQTFDPPAVLTITPKQKQIKKNTPYNAGKKFTPEYKEEKIYIFTLGHFLLSRFNDYRQFTDNEISLLRKWFDQSLQSKSKGRERYKFGLSPSYFLTCPFVYHNFSAWNEKNLNKFAFIFLPSGKDLPIKNTYYTLIYICASIGNISIKDTHKYNREKANENIYHEENRAVLFQYLKVPSCAHNIWFSFQFSITMVRLRAYIDSCNFLWMENHHTREGKAKRV